MKPNSQQVKFFFALVVVLILIAGIIYFANPQERIKKTFFETNKDLLDLDNKTLSEHLDFYSEEQILTTPENSDTYDLSLLINEETLTIANKLELAKIDTTFEYLRSLNNTLKDSKCPSNLEQNCRIIDDTFSGLDPYLEQYKNDYIYFDLVLTELEDLQLSMRGIGSEIEIYIDDPSTFNEESYLTLIDSFDTKFSEFISKLESYNSKENVIEFNQILISDLTNGKDFIIQNYESLIPKLRSLKSKKSSGQQITRADAISIFDGFLASENALDIKISTYDIKNIFPVEDNTTVVNLMTELGLNLDVIRSNKF